MSGPFYLVAMPEEVEYPTQGVKCVTCCILQIKSNQFYLYTTIFENDSGMFTVQKIN